MTHEQQIKVLNNPKATKEQLRIALAASLGVQYVPESKEKKESQFNECKALFFSFYKKETGLIYSFTGQDAKSLKELIGKIRMLYNYPANEYPVVETFGMLLEKLPDWYKKNAFSLPVINKKFNEIVASIKQNVGKGQTISDSYRQKIINDLQS